MENASLQSVSQAGHSEPLSVVPTERISRSTGATWEGPVSTPELPAGTRQENERSRQLAIEPHDQLRKSHFIGRKLDRSRNIGNAKDTSFLRIIEPGQTVVDVGMHLGYHATLFARLVGPQGAVHAFEPTPSTRELAAHNVGQFKNITVHPFGVWSSAEKLTLNDFGPQWMAFNSFMGPRMESGPPSPTPDLFRQQLGQNIALVKTDAESAEMEILKGAAELLGVDKPLITLEVGDSENYNNSRNLVDSLYGLGYRAWDIDRGRFRPHQKLDRYDYDNLIFGPTDRNIGK